MDDLHDRWLWHEPQPQALGEHALEAAARRLLLDDVAVGPWRSPRDPTGREMAVDDAVSTLYQLARLRPPAAVLHVRSPAVGIYLVSLLRNCGPSVSGQIHDSIRGPAGSAVSAASSLRGPMRSVLHEMAANWVDTYSDGDLRQDVVDALRRMPPMLRGRSPMDDDFDADVALAELSLVLRRAEDDWPSTSSAFEQVSRLRGAVHAAYEETPSFVAYAAVLADSGFPRLGGPLPGPAVDAALLLCAPTVWWWPLRDIAVVSARPDEVHLDGDGRLHRHDGPAVRYPSGWSTWAHHGVVVPRGVIERTIRPRDVLALRNVEVRRAAVDVMGWELFMDAAFMRRLGEDRDPGNPGCELELWAADRWIYGAPVNVLVCTNGSPERDGTRRRYHLAVPPWITDPVEAAAWTYDMPVEQYRGLARRT